MNIAHFVIGRCNPYAPPSGVEKFVFHLAQTQAQAGHTVSVISITTHAGEPLPVKPDDFDIREYPFTRSKFILSRQFKRDIEEGRIKLDIGHLHSVFKPELWAAGRFLRRLGVPYVITPHGGLSPWVINRSRLKKAIFNYLFQIPLYNAAAKIHILVEKEVSDLRRLGIRSPTFMIGHGFDLTELPERLNRDWFISKGPMVQNSFKLIFLGRLDPFHKGLDLLIKGFSIAISRLKDIPMSLVLIGAPFKNNQKVISSLVKECKVDQRVFFTGPIYGADKYHALASADIYVQTSRWEGMPLTLIEALACSTPCIITTATNTAELILRCGAGFVTGPTPEDIAAKIIQAVEQREGLHEMGKNGRRLVEQEFDWARTAEVICNNYLEIINKTL
ncbi:MAG: glycosyltransferase [Nitrospinota bacterium]